jgi:hypothetical protein
LGNELILRIRIPDTQELLLDPKKRKKFASEELNDFTQNETDVLTKLTKDGCSSAPRLISWKREKQDKNMPVPDGYVVYILMEKLPGVHPLDFWAEELFSRRDRDEIRRAFREAMRCVNAFLWRGHRSEFNVVSEIFKCGIVPMDTSMENILWDKTGKKW